MDISRHYYNPSPLQQARVQAAAAALRLKVHTARAGRDNTARIEAALREVRGTDAIVINTSGAKTA